VEVDEPVQNVQIGGTPLTDNVPNFAEKESIKPHVDNTPKPAQNIHQRPNIPPKRPNIAPRRPNQPPNRPRAPPLKPTVATSILESSIAEPELAGPQILIEPELETEPVLGIISHFKILL
jgi:hypothetical protein